MNDKGLVVDVVQTGQTCLKCTYPMDGQQVFVREDMMLALTRCPECGTAQPLGLVGPDGRAGKRAVRDASKGLLNWVAGICLMIAVISGSVAGLAQSTGFAMGYPLADWIAEHAPSGWSRWSYVPDVWWERTGRERLAQQDMQPSDLIDWLVLTDVLWAVPIAIGSGLWFHAATLHGSRRGRQCLGVLIMLLSSLMIAGYLVATRSWIEDRTASAADLAMNELGWVFALASWVVIAGIVAIGLWRGRVMLRMLVLHLGGPRQRAWASPLFEKSPESVRPEDH